MRYATDRQVRAAIVRKAEVLEGLARGDVVTGLSSRLIREGISADAIRLARSGGVVVRSVVVPLRVFGAYGVDRG